MSEVTETEFSLAVARNHIKDLFAPNPAIYWLDFGLTYVAGVFCFQQVRGGSILVPHQGYTGSFSQWLYFAASCLLFYRASMFIHEVVHQRTSQKLPAFRFAWNLMCGIPFLIPSFIYYTHIDHHRRQHFGTDRDGEYMPLEHWPRWQILFYLMWSFIIPVLAIVRFLILTPIAWIVPGIRPLVHRHASSMVMDPTYIRPLPKKETLRIIYLQEAGCFLWCLAIASYAPLVLGKLPIPFLVQAYATAVVVLFLNSVRTLGSHRWSNEGDEMSFTEQLLDSVNYPDRACFSELWGPVGTRYHALHHLFPSLPYHALPTAHSRLARALPDDSPYHQVREESLASGLLDLWQRSKKAAKRAG